MRIKRWGNRWSDEGKHQHIKKWKKGHDKKTDDKKARNVEKNIKIRDKNE